MENVLNYISLLGPISIALLLAVLGRLSRELGRVTHARPYYLGLYVAAFGVLLATGVRFLNIRLAETNSLYDNKDGSILYNGLIAFSFTIGLVVAWRYWSWLIAERD